jgi:hypothetical protein
VLHDNAFGFLAGSSVAPIEGISEGVESLQPVAAAYSATSDTAAVKIGNGAVYAVRGSESPVLLDQRASLIDPAIDPFGYVWSVPVGSPTSVTAYGVDGAAITIPTNWDGASGITSLEISRDGTRALAFLSADGLPKLVVAAVIRNHDGVPQRLGQPVELASSLGTPVDATWVDQFTVASVTVSASGETLAMSQELGGQSAELGSPASAVTVAGGNDLESLRVLSADGSLQQQRGSAWQVTATGITRLAVQN